MNELIQVGQALSGLPMHAILLLAVIVLWRRINELEKKLEECLRGSAREQ